MGSKANIQLFIFLATTLDTSVHNLSYSAVATTAPEWFWECNLKYLRCKVFIYFSTSPQIHFSNHCTVHSFGFLLQQFLQLLAQGINLLSPRHNLLLAVLDSLQGGLRQSRLLQPQTSAHSSHEACVFILYLLLKLPDVIFQLLLLIPGSLLSVLLLFTTYLVVEKPDSTKAMG